MQVKHCRIIVFSPTGTTRKLAEAVAEGIGLPCTVDDMTLPEQRKRLPEFAEGDLVLLAGPVYYGRLQAHAAEIVSGLKGNGLPAVLLVNYGNRHYDDALLELFRQASSAGFVPVAAGAFVSEHSLCTEEFPMAPGRPDAADLAEAVAFGKRIAEKPASGGAALASVPGSPEFKPYPDFHRKPVWSGSCSLCGTCAAVCPTGAISVEGDTVETREELCIVCQACVKGCPEGARVDTGPGAREGRERLAPLTAQRRKAELFL